MTTERPGRLLSTLPAIYAESDTTGDLARLLSVFEALFFDDPAGRRDGHSTAALSREADMPDAPPLPGFERLLSLIPLVLSPRPIPARRSGEDATSTQAPDAFVRWIAAWLSFTPHTLFDTPALRRIVAGIVPMDGLRGTRGYLLRLIELCFGDELSAVEIDDSPHAGFIVGRASIGRDTQLSATGAFRFRVLVSPRPDAAPSRRVLERRLRAVIDHARPAHTAYDLHWTH